MSPLARLYVAKIIDFVKNNMEKVVVIILKCRLARHVYRERLPQVPKIPLGMTCNMFIIIKLASNNNPEPQLFHVMPDGQEKIYLAFIFEKVSGREVKIGIIIDHLN